jgi:hypothetical protein
MPGRQVIPQESTAEALPAVDCRACIPKETAMGIADRSTPRPGTAVTQPTAGGAGRGRAYRTWTERGRGVLRQVNADLSRDGQLLTQELVAQAITRLRWQPWPATLPPRPGQAIRQVIRELVLPRVDLISYRSRDLAPHALYGIQANFTDGRARYHVLGSGQDLTVLAVDFWPIPPCRRKAQAS